MPRPHLLPLLAASLLLAAPPAGADAETAKVSAAGETRDYGACMQLARDRPAAGYENARRWAETGGGDGARHCAAVALIGLGHFPEAAEQLEALAESLALGAPATTRAELLAQAGQAWLQAEQPDRAYAAQTTALDLLAKAGKPRAAVEIHIDRAVTLAAKGHYWEAIDDLNLALETDPRRVDALVLRASAYRYVDAPDFALENVERALAIAPEHPEALLERGILRRIKGDVAGARADWLKLLDLHPGTAAADAAQRNLELLDVKKK